MATLFEYVEWRGDLTFEQSPFSEIDALILAELAYVPFDGYVTEEFGGSVTLASSAKAFFHDHKGTVDIGAILPQDIIRLYRVCAKSRRFAKLVVSGYVSIHDTETKEQFSATCFATDRFTAVAFRGTDDSIVGWREDCNMSFCTPVPSQISSQSYLQRAMDALPGRFIVLGHSKGGNLSIWSSAHAREPERIDTIYSFDGPGFCGTFRSGSGYLGIQSRIRAVFPECSVVGMFFDHEENYELVKSSNKGLLQHDAFSWSVTATRFEKVQALDPEITRINTVLSAWITELDNNQRERFIDAFFGIFDEMNSKTLAEAFANKRGMFRAFAKMDPETRNAIHGTLRLLFGESKQSVVKRLEETRLIKLKSSGNDEEKEKKKEPLKLLK